MRQQITPYWEKMQKLLVTALADRYPVFCLETIVPKAAYLDGQQIFFYGYMQFGEIAFYARKQRKAKGNTYGMENASFYVLVDVIEEDLPPGTAPADFPVQVMEKVDDAAVVDGQPAVIFRLSTDEDKRFDGRKCPHCGATGLTWLIVASKPNKCWVCDQWITDEQWQRMREEAQ